MKSYGSRVSGLTLYGSSVPKNLSLYFYSCWNIAENRRLFWSIVMPNCLLQHADLCMHAAILNSRDFY